MLQKWLNTNSVNDYDLSTPLFPPAKDRTFWADKGDTSLILQAEAYLACDPRHRLYGIPHRRKPD